MPRQYSPSNEIVRQISAGNYAGFRTQILTQQADTLQFGANPFVRTMQADQRTNFLQHLGRALRGTAVTSVDLGGNHIGAEAPAFAQALRGTTVTFVDLAGNNIGAAAPAFAEGLRGTAVTSVELRRNLINNSMVAPLVEALRGGQVITVDYQANNISAENQQLLTNVLADNRAQMVAHTSLRQKCINAAVRPLKHSASIQAASMQHTNAATNQFLIGVTRLPRHIQDELSDISGVRIDVAPSHPSSSSESRLPISGTASDNNDSATPEPPRKKLKRA